MPPLFRRIIYHNKKILWRGVAGAVFATPVVAILQGSYLLYDYRVHHGEAPRPDMPSRGLVVVRHPDKNDNGAEDEREEHHSEFLWRPIQDIWMNSRNNIRRITKQRGRTQQQQQQSATPPPLRVLVIGDSLAAGVGTSRQRTPVLPESIASSLSQFLNGRPVVWECVGVPGQCTSEIVRDIHHLDELLPQPVTLYRQFQDWQFLQRQIYQDRMETAKRRTKEWLEHRRQDEKANRRQQNGDKNTNNVHPVVRWWNRTRRQIKNDMDALRHVVIQNDGADDPTTTEAAAVSRKTSSLSRRNTASLLDPDIIGKYDVAVVLTGLNDLKESFLPFMFSKQRAEAMKAQKSNHDDGLKGELIRVLQALESRMKGVVLSIQMQEQQQQLPHGGPNDGRSGDSSDSAVLATQQDQQRPQEDKQSQQLPRSSQKVARGPLVVFPALPYEPTILSQHAPLSWFIVPLLDMVDRNKQVIADLYPDRVVYVAAPDDQDISNAHAKRGAQWQDFDVLLQLHHQQDGTRKKVKERIESAVKQQYSNWIQDYEDKDSEYLYQWDDVFDVSLINHHQLQQEETLRVRATMVAADGIHPSDYGYDVWGRHIANAVVKEWEKRDRDEELL